MFEMKLNKEEVTGHTLQFSIVLLTGLVLFLDYIEKENYLLIISAIFFITGGLSEYIFMNHFYAKGNKSLKKSDRLIKKIKNSFLLVHANIYFIKKYGATIYNFKETVIILSVVPYLIMLLYILVAHIFYRIIGYSSFIIYLIPVITNTYYFLKNRYYILN